MNIIPVYHIYIIHIYIINRVGNDEFLRNVYITVLLYDYYEHDMIMIFIYLYDHLCTSSVVKHVMLAKDV